MKQMRSALSRHTIKSLYFVGRAQPLLSLILFLHFLNGSRGLDIGPGISLPAMALNYGHIVKSQNSKQSFTVLGTVGRRARSDDNFSAYQVDWFDRMSGFSSDILFGNENDPILRIDVIFNAVFHGLRVCDICEVDLERVRVESAKSPRNAPHFVQGSAVKGKVRDLVAPYMAITARRAPLGTAAAHRIAVIPITAGRVAIAVELAGARIQAYVKSMCSTLPSSCRRPISGATPLTRITVDDEGGEAVACPLRKDGHTVHQGALFHI
jgi:hypothetical protein